MPEHDDPSSPDAFLKFMARHLVGLTGFYKSYDRDGKAFAEGAFALSGFVVEIAGIFFWVTAGHCLEELLDTPLREGSLRLFHTGFADYFGSKAQHFEPIPYTYEPGSAFYLQQPELGLDFGLLPLSSLTCRALIANGIKAVGRENWVHQHRIQFEHYKMLGFPAHRIEYSRMGPQLTAGIGAQMIQIDRLDPTEVPAERGEYFAGRIPDHVQIASIEGMSGGPIFGFRKNESGRWTYHIVALQSAWREQSRLIFGCSLPTFAEGAYQVVQACLEKVGSDSNPTRGRSGD
jgi:hypothetical protein